MNKFVKIYPQLGKPQEGDTIQVINAGGNSEYYKTNDFGKVLRVFDNQIVVDFNHKQNQQVHGFGIYWVNATNVRIINTSEQVSEEISTTA